MLNIIIEKIKSSIYTIILVLLVILSCDHLWALSYKEVHLSNGLKAYLFKIKSPLTVHTIVYSVGSLEEFSKREGIAHWLEHSMFLGTNRYSKEALSSAIRDIGATYNASTYYDYTNYYYVFPNKYLKNILAIESDRMKWLKLDPQDISNERSVINEERNMRENNVYNNFFESYNSIAFPNTNYGRSVIGRKKDFESISFDDLKNFYQTWYVPNNATVVIVGDIDLNKTALLVKDYYGGLTPNLKIDSLRPNYNEPDYHVSTHIVYKNRLLKQNVLLKSFLVPSLISAKDKKQAYMLNLWANFLSSSDSYLYKDIVYDKKLAISVSVDYNMYRKGNGLFSISIVPTAKGKDSLKLESIMNKDLEYMAHRGITIHEKNEVISAIYDRFELEKEDHSQFAIDTAIDLSMGVNLKDILHPKANYSNVTVAELNQIFSDLIKKNSIVAIAEQK